MTRRATVPRRRVLHPILTNRRPRVGVLTTTGGLFFATLASLLTIAMLLIAPSVASAATGSVDADAYIQTGGQADANNGGGMVVNVSNSQTTLFRFDLSSFADDIASDSI